MNQIKKLFLSLLMGMISAGLAAQLSATVEWTNVSCFGGSDGKGEVTSVLGGVPPYTYQWTYNDLTPIVDSTNSSISGLPQGTYFVYVYDADSSNFDVEGNTIVDGPNIAMLAFPTDLTCNGADDGSIFVIAAGGNQPLEFSKDGGVTYQSSNTFDSLPAANYNIFIRDSKGCTKPYDFNPVTISQPDPLIASLVSKKDINCFGANNGEINVSTTGGTTPYDFAWDKDGSFFADTEDISSLAPGNYSLAVDDDNGCSTSLLDIEIIEAPQIIISSVIPTPEKCFNQGDGTVTVTANGGTGTLYYRLKPSTGPPKFNTDGLFTNLSGNTYSLTITDDSLCGPVTQTGIVVENPPVITVDTWDTTSITCNGADNGIISVSGKGGTPPYNYTLNDPGATSNATGIFTGLSPQLSYQVTITDSNSCPPANSPSWDFTEPAVIAISIDSTRNVTCNGDGDGMIFASATGGSGSYIYTLTPGPQDQTNGNFTGLTGGTYSISVTDTKGCTPDVATGINIVDPAPITISNIDTTDVTCNGDSDGTVIVSASGGTGLLHYTLNPGGLFNNDGNFTGLGPATYDVSVTDDNGCPAATAANLEVIEPDLISLVSETSTPILCAGDNNGSITIVAAGGTNPLDYTLNDPGATNNAIGIFTGLSPQLGYQVTITDVNGCPSVTSTPVDIIDPAPITLAGVDTNDITCSGLANGSLSVLAAGGTAPYLYTLTPGPVSQTTGDFSDLTGGTYAVSVTDTNSCPPASLTNLIIIDPAPIIISNIDTTDVTCNGVSDGTVIVTASGGTGLLHYTLNPGGLFNNDGDFTGLGPATYDVSVTDDNGCPAATAADLVVFEPPAISIDLEESTEIQCFGANDASIRITASGGNGTLTYTLRNPDSIAVNQTGFFKDIGPGSYTVGVDDDNGCGPLNSNAFSFVDPIPLAVTVDGSSSKVLACFGDSTGSLDITVTGGTTPYTYNWTGPNGYTNNIEDISGLKAGDYNLTLRDANNCLIDSIPLDSITGPSQLTMSFAKSNVTCFNAGDGSVTITSGGGIPPYEYSNTGFTWQASNVFSPLNPGPHIFYTKDDNDCEINQGITIDQPQEIKINQVLKNDSLQVCNGDSNGIISISAMGGTGALEYSIDTGNTYFPNNLFTGLGGGIYKVAVRDTNSCEIIDDGAPSILNPTLLLVDTLITQDITSCFTSPEGKIFINGEGGSPPMKYILNASDTSLTGLFENLVQGPHDLRISDSKGCTKDTSASISAPPPITIDTLVTDVSTCYGDSSGTIALIATGGTGLTKGYVFQGDTTLSNDTVFYTNLPGGTYDFTVFDSLGCETLPSAFIDSPDSISTDSVLVSPVTCNGNTDGSIMIYGSGGTAPYSYILNPGADTSVTGIYNGLAAGDYTVSVNDAMGCKPYVTPVLTVIEPPTLVFDSSAISAISCGGFFDGAIAIFASGGLPPYSYSVDDGGSFGPDMVVTGLGPGTYFIHVSDSAGCSVPGDTIVLSDPPGLNLDPSSVTDVALCAGDSSGAISVSATGGTGALEYSLDSTNWQSSGNFNNLPAGIYVPVVRDSKSCILAFPADTIGEPPAISATITTAVAMIPALGSISISATGGTPPLEYSIDSGASFSTQTIFNVPSDIYGVVVRDTNSCTYEESVFVPATPPLEVSVSSIQIDCNNNNNGSISLSALNSEGIVLYSIEGGQNFQLTGDFTDLPGGTYPIHVKDSHRVFRDTVIIIDPPPFDVSSTVQEASCSRNSYDGAIALSVNGATPPYSYLWSTGDLTKDLSDLEGMTYSVEITDANACTFSTDIIVPATVDLIADAGPDTVVCYGTVLTLNGSGGDQFVWEPEEGLSQTDIPNPVTTVLDSVSFILFTRDQLSGCSDSDTVNLSTHADRGISAGQDTTIAPGQSITLTASGGPFSTYLWQPSEGLESPNSQTTIATVNTEITYTVTGTTEFGCQESDSMNIDIATGLGIYSGFTPNDDGINDFWDIDDIIFYPNTTVKVFDRWGKVVFSSVGYADNQRWDGKYKGKKLPVGTYYYIIDLKDGSEPYKGPVTIVTTK